MITLSITVHPSGAGMGSGSGMRIFEKQLDWVVPPQRGDLVEWMLDEEGESWGGNGQVLHRWFHGDGSIAIELVPFQLCKTPRDQEQCRGGYRTGWFGYDGDIFEILARSGFTEHE